MKATLVLENGSSFEGISAGVPGEKIGEVILNTSVVGYQEMITDPANAGKILVLTYPLIGNYGVAAKFNESSKCWLAGLVISQSSRIYSNWQAEGSFADFLKIEKVLAANEVDTRTLAIEIRDSGEMTGIISTGGERKEDLLKKLRSEKENRKKDFIKDVSVRKPTEIKTGHSAPAIAVLDLGMCNSFIWQLKTLGCRITLLPYDTRAEEIVKLQPDGLIISGGPENDPALHGIAACVKSLIGRLPLFGISTGHHAIAMALGCSLKRMKTGHRGVNYPVRGPDSYKGRITVQNHSYIVDDGALRTKKDVAVTLRNINDDTIEEMESKRLKFISAQYYPSSPGFNEVNNAFRRFLAMIGHKRKSHPVKTAAEVKYAKA